MAFAASSQPSFNVAIIGGGIAGTCAASILSSAAAALKTSTEPRTKHRRNGPDEKRSGLNIRVDLFDQGRSGVGGRSSHRRVTVEGVGNLRWDHGCQFFRADTKKFKEIVNDWKGHGIVSEWNGRFTSDDPTPRDGNFFGLPSEPPFYVGADGMDSIPKGVLGKLRSDADIPDVLNTFERTRVARIERDVSTRKWHLFGTSGEIAFHDTPEKIVRRRTDEVHSLGRHSAKSGGYDAVIFTDVSSSSFGTWHRAGADGVPPDFAMRVRERVGARVPLFTAMIAFEESLVVPFDAISFSKSESLWFASRTKSKLSGADDMAKDCWTLVSTPEYAMERITQTPMQDPKTGDFIPQSKDYLSTVPGPELESAFGEALKEEGFLKQEGTTDLPKTVYLDAQRWGSAMPCHRHLDETSSTRKVISGVPYDSGRSSLAPTKLETCRKNGTNGDDDFNFVADDDLMIFQAGDMMSRYTPGYEGAALSGIDTAEHLLDILWKKVDP